MDQLLLEDHFYFNAIASALVVFICFLLSKSSKTKGYVGFIYLFGIPLKGVFYYKRFPFLFSAKTRSRSRGKSEYSNAYATFFSSGGLISFKNIEAKPFRTDLIYK
jgi:membrane-bound metal-dependent hydrolase YbcI (DUF457 family)